MRHLLLLALVGCDPTYRVNGTIVVPALSQQAVPMPSQVLLRIVAPFAQTDATRLAIVCDARPHNVTATWTDGGTCGVETEYQAWLAPLTDPVVSCGALPEPVDVYPVPTLEIDTPRSRGSVFLGHTLSRCAEGT